MKRQSWRLAANAFELADVDRGRLFAQHVLAGCQSPQADRGVTVGMGADVNRIHIGGEQLVERTARVLYGEPAGESFSALQVTAPHRRQFRAGHRFEPLSESRARMAGAGYAPTNDLLPFVPARRRPEAHTLT